MFERDILVKAVNCGVYSQPVVIPSIYQKGARPSHFWPVRDVVNITLMVAGHVLRCGLAPVRLLRSLRILPLPKAGGQGVILRGLYPG